MIRRRPLGIGARCAAILDAGLPVSLLLLGVCLASCATPTSGSATPNESAGVETASATPPAGEAPTIMDSVGAARAAPSATSPPFDGFEILESAPNEGLVAHPQGDRRSTGPLVLEADALLPEAPQTQRWRVVRGTDMGTTFDRVISKGSSLGATIEDRWGDRRTYFLASNADGAAVMTGTTAHEDRATTLFEPPLGVAPATLTQGRPFDARSAMRVMDEHDLRTLRHRGRCERRIVLETSERIRTPMGEFDALRLRVEFSATLALATASDVVVLHVVPGLGVVAEEREEKITAIGFVNRSRRNVLVRER